MERLFILLLLAFLSGSGKSQTANFNKIRIEDVVLRFAQSYIIDNEEDGFITFEKRKEGYVVVSNRYENGFLRPYKRQVYYSNLDTGYSMLGFTENNVTKDALVSEYLNDYLIRNFNLQILYNYPGWYNDVIDSLKDKKPLSDDELYGLGRAYNQAFFDLLKDQDDDPVNQWSLKKDINCLTKVQIAVIDSLSKKTLACYKQLMERNPSYETALGPIGVKYANEVVTHFHVMLTFANERALSMKLPAGLYPEEFLNPVRNSLRYCPPNAILLSFGDNDFYPVLYLQQQEKLRKDVYLINYNLAGVDQYIFRSTKRQFDSPGIKISVDSSVYSGRVNEYISINNEPGIISFYTMLPLLKKTKWPDDNSPVVKGDRFALSTSSGKKIFSLGETYILKNHWIILNIIENLGTRKLCLPAQFEDPLFKDLNRFFMAKNNIWILK